MDDRTLLSIVVEWMKGIVTITFLDERILCDYEDDLNA